MKHAHKKYLFIGLCAVVFVEILSVNYYLSEISYLRKERIPAAKKNYKQAHTLLDEIREYTEQAGGSAQGRRGIPLQGQFREWARKAGIESAPEVRQYRSRSTREQNRIHISDVTIRKADAKSIFAFLRILEGTGPDNRIREVFINDHRGEPNMFYLRVLVATYLQSESGSRSREKN